MDMSLMLGTHNTNCFTLNKPVPLTSTLHWSTVFFGLKQMKDANKTFILAATTITAKQTMHFLDIRKRG
jgi:hypothetical protein